MGRPIPKMRTSMFFVVAFFVINANASPTPKFFQEALAVPAECRNQEHDGWCDYHVETIPDGPADEYVGNWKHNSKTSAYVWKCDKISPICLECTGSDAKKSKLTIMDGVVLFDALKDGFEPVEGILVETPEEDSIDFGKEGLWVRQAEEATVQEVPRDWEYPY